MVYKTFNGISFKLKDPQLVIRTVKSLVSKREREGRVLSGNWIRVIDLIREMRQELSLLVSCNEVVSLSNTCSLCISNCGRFIRNASNKDSIRCSSFEIDSIWFSQEIIDIPNGFYYSTSVVYKEIKPYVIDDYTYELQGAILFKTIVPLIEINSQFYIPIPLMEA